MRCWQYSEYLLLYCCIRAVPNEVAFNGVFHGCTGLGGDNRTGGAAKGMPKYCLTSDVAARREGVVPKVTPSETTTTVVLNGQVPSNAVVPSNEDDNLGRS